ESFFKSCRLVNLTFQHRYILKPVNYQWEDNGREQAIDTECQSTVHPGQPVLLQGPCRADSMGRRAQGRAHGAHAANAQGAQKIDPQGTPQHPDGDYDPRGDVGHARDRFGNLDGNGRGHGFRGQGPDEFLGGIHKGQNDDHTQDTAEPSQGDRQKERSEIMSDLPELFIKKYAQGHHGRPQQKAYEPTTLVIAVKINLEDQQQQDQNGDRADHGGGQHPFQAFVQLFGQKVNQKGQQDPNQGHQIQAF